MKPGAAGTLDDTSRFQMLSHAPTGRQGRPFADDRTMLDAIIHRYRCIDPLAEKCGPGTGA